MLLTPSFSNALQDNKLHIWVLAPSLETDDENISYYYDFSQSIEEYTRVFSNLGIEWRWQPVTMSTVHEVIGLIESERALGEKIPVILNLCDGDEINGTPGISVLKLLDEKEMPYTGADAYFYEITTSKLPMKRAFDEHAVPTPAWMEIHDAGIDAHSVFSRLGSPVIIKPAVSGGSMGVGVRNVVDTKENLKALVHEMFGGYRGWNLTADGMIAEEFIEGREFTVLISGSWDDETNAVVYTPFERVFHRSLPDREKFLSFDRLWEIYEKESAMPGDENFYEYALPEESLIEPLNTISWEAYCATRGKGYTRIDIRMDNKTGKLFVLEDNAQCGIREDENYTSIGAILRLSGKTFSKLVLEILHDAWIRYENRKLNQSAAGNNARA